MKHIASALAALAIATGAFASYAQDEEEEQGLKTLAVQNRQNTMMNEFSAWVGTLPLDAFTKGLTFTGAYTLHFTDLIAWEVGQFTYSYGIDTDLKDELADLVVGPTPFETVDYFATSSFVLKPAYAKIAVLNNVLVYGELFIVVGGGYGWMTLSNRPVATAGGGMRIYVGKYVSFRLDIRDYMFFNLDDLQNELWIALGVCLAFG